MEVLLISREVWQATWHHRLDQRLLRAVLWANFFPEEQYLGAVFESLASSDSGIGRKSSCSSSAAELKGRLRAKVGNDGCWLSREVRLLQGGLGHAPEKRINLKSSPLIAQKILQNLRVKYPQNVFCTVLSLQMTETWNQLSIDRRVRSPNTRWWDSPRKLLAAMAFPSAPNDMSPGFLSLLLNDAVMAVKKLILQNSKTISNPMPCRKIKSHLSFPTASKYARKGTNIQTYTRTDERPGNMRRQRKTRKISEKVSFLHLLKQNRN